MQLHFGVKETTAAVVCGPWAGCRRRLYLKPSRSGPLADYLNALDGPGELPKTILYSLNPADNAVIGALIGCFQGDGILGKVQQGSAWWFNDHKDGMEAQIKSLASLGLLGSLLEC